jgi:magnesium transporter
VRTLIVAEDGRVTRDAPPTAIREMLARPGVVVWLIQSNRLNEIMKVLTIASIVLMSAALVTGFYGMNFRFMPELAWPLGEAYVLGLMALIATGLLIYFRRRRWL